jgi:hypothetical protein
MFLRIADIFPNHKLSLKRLVKMGANSLLNSLINFDGIPSLPFGLFDFKYLMDFKTSSTIFSGHPIVLVCSGIGNCCLSISFIVVVRSA